MTLVWDFYNKGGSEKLAMLALADWCDDRGLNLYPSIAGIAKKINTSESQARRIIHRFIDEGYLEVVGNAFGGSPTATRRYRMILSKFTATPSVGATPCTSATPSMGARDPLHGCALPLAPMTPEPPLTINKATAKEREPDASASRLPADWIPSDEDIEFCRSKRPDLNTHDIADAFRDYWISVPGVKGKKVDWHATWRTWVRKEQSAPNTVTGGKSNERLQRQRDTIAALTGESQFTSIDSIDGFAERVG